MKSDFGGDLSNIQRQISDIPGAEEVQRQITEAMKPLSPKARSRVMRAVKYRFDREKAFKDQADLDNFLAEEVHRAEGGVEMDVAKVSQTFEALTSWLHGHDLDTRFATPLEALIQSEYHMSSLLEFGDDTAVQGVVSKDAWYAVVSATRKKLELPRALGVYSPEDALVAIEKRPASDPEHQELCDYVGRSGKYTVLTGGDGKPHIMKREDAQVFRAGNAVLTTTDHLDETIKLIQRGMGDSTYYEQYLTFVSASPQVQIEMARRGQWVLSEETKTTHAKMIARRPKLIEAAHPFFISGKMIDEIEKNPPQEEKHFMIDCPFRTVWLERTDGGPLFFLQGSKGPSWIMGVLLHEEGPHGYLCESFLAQQDIATGRIKFHTYTTMLEPSTVNGRKGNYMPSDNPEMPTFDPGTMVQTATHDVLYWIFKRFRSECAFANEKITAIRKRVGSGESRTAVKINKIVRVMLKSERKEYERGAGRVVDWSHKWEVMGHWRRVDGIGKDREGGYTVRGFTWVKPHAKGKGDLVKKQRIVVDDETAAP